MTAHTALSLAWLATHEGDCLTQVFGLSKTPYLAKYEGKISIWSWMLTRRCSLHLLDVLCGHRSVVICESSSGKQPQNHYVCIPLHLLDVLYGHRSVVICESSSGKTTSKLLCLHPYAQDWDHDKGQSHLE